MNNGGDAAEQIVRLSLEGFEVAVRLTGSAAKNIAILLASVLKQEISQSNKTRGKARLTNMIKSGKELKVFSFQQKDLPKFTEQAKRYGVLYCVLRDKNTKSDTAMVDIIARAEDAAKIQRISDRFELGKVDKASIVSEAEKAVADREAAANEVPTKSRGEIIVEEAMGKPMQKEGNSHQNCDEFLYLGGNEQSTHKYVSELLGKETIDTNTYGKSEGRSGSYSTNYQISGRELLTPDEVRMLDNRYAILFIRGELPVMDLKYDILKHPNVAYTADGKGGVYQHGEVTKNVATIETLYVDLDSVPEMELSETTYELLSDEDFENLTN